jgi:serine/threonine protein kinase
MSEEIFETDLLETINSRGVLSEKDIARVLYYTLSQLVRIHEEGRVIGNLSPEAILLIKKGNRLGIKIDHMSQISMSPLFVAPEILNDRNFLKESDMWSIGVICYAALVGYPPFYDCSNEELIKNISHGYFEFNEPFWTNHSEEAKEFISKLLLVNPEERMTAIQALQSPFILRYNQNKPIRKESTGKGSVFSRLLRRS